MTPAVSGACRVGPGVRRTPYGIKDAAGGEAMARPDLGEGVQTAALPRLHATVGLARVRLRGAEEEERLRVGRTWRVRRAASWPGRCRSDRQRQHRQEPGGNARPPAQPRRLGICILARPPDVGRHGRGLEVTAVSPGARSPPHTEPGTHARALGDVREREAR